MSIRIWPPDMVPSPAQGSGPGLRPGVTPRVTAIATTRNGGRCPRRIKLAVLGGQLNLALVNLALVNLALAHLSTRIEDRLGAPVL